MEKEPASKGASSDKLAEMASDQVSTMAYKLDEETDKVANKLELVDLSPELQSVASGNAGNQVDEPVDDWLPLDQAHRRFSAAGSSSRSDAWGSIDAWRRALEDDIALSKVDKPPHFSDKVVAMLAKLAKKKMAAKVIAVNIPESPISKIIPEKSSISKLNPEKSTISSKLSKDWSSSPETGAYATGNWGPGQWSSCSSSVPSSGRYIDTWGREQGAVDYWFLSVTLVTDADGQPYYSVSFERADQATIDAASKPGSKIVLESRARVMTYWRSPSSQAFRLNPEEDLLSFGKRTHWSVANLGAQITAEEYCQR